MTESLLFLVVFRFCKGFRLPQQPTHRITFSTKNPPISPKLLRNIPPSKNKTPKFPANTRIIAASS